MTNPDIAVVTCALTGVLTNPAQHPVPVTASQMADAARQAFEAGASVMHVHFRSQAPNCGHLPSWEPEVAAEISDAIRAACPGVIMNFSTGTIGRDQTGPIACLERCQPEIAACNAGSLNYLKAKRDGTWAWPPMLFENTVSKIEELLAVMQQTNTRPEFECFDVGIVRSVGMYQKVGMIDRASFNFVMGVDSGMPADTELLSLLLKYLPSSNPWQTTLIGREEIWPVHQKAAELGGHLRTGLEDTFYLPNGERAANNGELISALVNIAELAGRKIATPSQAREIFL
ncbi:3-keto-5-aminohexanoate cleavage protein [Simiduia curdlanivorans]|uniref:3-keto-5-aminohexanoate cleavage protein n=1 Tax=Simiduia curdlanivorans TaxID=1492769 RepID=A0ABV8V9B0_9GAMM|nr:3-keto-5-aminohexanoate cleavage protein [Simiduia curdlanivorans]MDN3639656.1 3-keto-5-aminohexanoate cleavage protein [Simiduia curdlanivorans]